MKAPLRHNAVETFDEWNTGDNTGQRVPWIDWELVPESSNLSMDVYMAGGGCTLPGGCAVVAANRVEKIERVEWPELGMPESLWVCRVKEFGPLIVSIDVHGNNLLQQNKAAFEASKERVAEEIKKQVAFIG